ncbi:MAG TPA: aminotransferase class V-fold PLP-dependent enzyme [Methyloceanibacter sp.]|jgi:cysteine desulfurase family protein (TIGR01976 family)
MTADTRLDVAFCRRHFPALASGWVFMENAGGTLVPQPVIDRTANFMTHCQVQPGEGYAPSTEGARRIAEGRGVLAALINAGTDEIVIGPSTTSNVYVLSHALRPLLAAGDEIIVTNQDHEANNGAWRGLESKGMVIREWRMNEDSDDLEIEDLEALLTDKTKLVCFTHCSNIVGLIHDAKAMVRRIHEAGALACIDGVAFAPHRRVDVKDLDVDFYLYSPYKVFGPHMGVLYGKRDLLSLLTNQGHYFLPQDDFQRRLCPGGANYELSAAAAGIGDYFDRVHEQHYPGANLETRERLDRVFALFAAHETAMASEIEDFLTGKTDVRLAGGRAPAARERVGIFSFTVDGRDSREIPEALRSDKIGIHADDFYAARCIDALGARPQNGVVRVSLVHYNSDDDVERVIAGLDQVL